MTYYLISELAKKTTLSTDTIRFYEKKGLLHAQFRADNNYRYYAEDALKRLIFIKRCRTLDMSLKEIQLLIELEQKPQQNCDPINAMIEQHLIEISNKINELEKLKQQLTTLSQSCHTGSSVGNCQILKQLETD